MPWYAYLALKQLFPTGKRVSFFAVMAIVGVMLGVMVLLVVQSVMNGFSHKIQETVQRTTGDIRIISTEGIVYNWEKVIEVLEGLDSIESAAPFAEGKVMLKHEDHPAFPNVHGLDVELEKKVVPLNEFIVSGNLDDLDDLSVVVSSGLASILDIEVGDEVEVYTPLLLEALKKDELLLPRELEVVAIFQTGWNKVDSELILTSRGLMQDLYGLGTGVHGFTAKLAKGADPDKTAAQLNTIFNPKMKAYTWMDTHEDFLFVLRMEKTMMFFIILFVILVASFSIASSLMTTVVRKTREIGLLGALGARSSRIALIYCFQGLFIGVIGTILGVLGAMLALHYRNNIVHVIASIFQREDILSKFYGFSDIPSHYLASDFVIIIGCSLLIATFAGLIPALRAAKLKPAEALRNE